MPRSTLARYRNRAIFSRDPDEGGGGGTGDNQQGGTGDNQQGGTGGDNQQQQNSGPVDATDEHGASLGFPKDTAVKDMNDAQKANYWRNQAKVQQRKAEALERAQNGGKNQQESGTVQNQQQSGAEKTVQVDEVAIRREAGKDAASAAIRSSLALRGKNAEEIDDIVDVIDTAKFLTADHKLDAAKIAAFVTKTVPVRGSEGGNPGQGQQQQKTESKAAAGKAAAEARWGSRDQNQNRGTYGGLRR